MTVLSARHPLRRAADDALRSAGLNSRANALLISPTFACLNLNISGAATALYDAMAVARAAGVDTVVDPTCKRVARALDALGEAAFAEENSSASIDRVADFILGPMSARSQRELNLVTLKTRSR